MIRKLHLFCFRRFFFRLLIKSLSKIQFLGLFCFCLCFAEFFSNLSKVMKLANPVCVCVLMKFPVVFIFHWIFWIFGKKIKLSKKITLQHQLVLVGDYRASDEKTLANLIQSEAAAAAAALNANHIITSFFLFWLIKTSKNSALIQWWPWWWWLTLPSPDQYRLLEIRVLSKKKRKN